MKVALTGPEDGIQRDRNGDPFKRIASQVIGWASEEAVS